MVSVPAPRFAAQALPIQVSPVFSGVVDSQFPSCSHSLRNHNYALNAKPCEGLELAIRLTGMIDESRIVTSPPLPNLVRWMLPNLHLHHVKVLQASGNQANKFSNCCSSRKVLQRISVTIVHLLFRRLTQQAMRPLFRPSSVRKTCTGHESRALAP